MRHAKKLLVAASAALALASGTLAAPASAATHYTATSCSGKSAGQCLWSNAGGSGSQAWDDRPKDNQTLDDWAYYRTSTSIGRTISSASVGANYCILRYYYAQNSTGSYVEYNSNGASGGLNFPGSFNDHVFSFNWYC